MKLRNKTVLITGGSSGIGLEMARQLRAGGNTVLVTGRGREKLDAATREVPGIHAFQSDVSDPKAIVALRDEVLARFPALDVLINNAGVMRNLDFNMPDLENVAGEIEINLSGPVRMIQQFLPHLKTRPEAMIVNVSSGLAFVPFPAAPVYSATKAGLHGFTSALRVQLQGTSVAVVELAPPGVETPLFRTEFQEETKDQKAMDPAKLVRLALRGIEKGKTEIQPGLSGVLKFLGRLAPKTMLKQLTKPSKFHT